MELTRTKFKKTEVGLIPEDWDTPLLSDIKTLMTNGFVGTAKTEYTNSSNGVLYIQGYNVIANGFDFHGIKKVNVDFHKRNAKSCLKEGDLLTVQTGDVGLTTFVPKHLEGSNCHALIITRFNISRVHYLFMAHYFNSNMGRGRMKELETGTTMKHLNVGEMFNWRVPLPPTLTEQKAIATALSDVDELIANLEKLIEKKKAIKKGTIQEKLKPKAHWETKQIRDLAKYRRGSFPQPYGLSKWYDDVKGTPFVQVVDVDDNKKLKRETKARISKEGQQFSVFVPKGSIILTIQGSIGRICITDYDTYVDRTLLIFESFQVEFDKYFFMMSIFLKFEIEKEKAPGGIIKTITKEALSSFEISYPPIEEQVSISGIINSIELEIETLKIKHEKLKIIKQGMMQELLTGRTRLV